MEMVGKRAYYIIVSAYSDKQDDDTNEYLNSKLLDTLYRKEYKVLKLDNNIYGESFLAFKEDMTSDNNNELRKDSIYLIDTYFIEKVIVKYYNELNPKRLKSNGHESPMELTNYNGDFVNSYYTEGSSFSFIEKDVYTIPKLKNDFKKGQLIEIKNNNNKWVCREVLDVDAEWENMYKLLVKYEKVRCLINYDKLLS